MPQDKLLLIDDDLMIVKLYEKYFAKHFTVVTANSAEEATSLINKGYIPDVVLSDNLMPGETGSDFLHKLSQTHPDTIRILMTAETDTQKLIHLVQHAKAFMFLTKPIRELDLIQAINIAFKHFKCQSKNKEILSKNVNPHKSETNLHHEQHNEGPLNESSNMMFKTFIKFSTFRGNYYYSHFEKILKMSKHFVDDLKLNNSVLQNVFSIEIMYSMMMQSFPFRLAYKDPYELDEQDRNSYIKRFNDFLQISFKNSLLKENDPFAQIWEHFDGTGLPNQIKGMDIRIEAQIFQLCNLYFHKIYELPNSDLINRFQVTQYPYKYEASFDKMKNAQKYLFDKQKWFNPEVFNIFRYAIKENRNELFLPIRENKSVENLMYFPEFEMIMKELNQFKESQESAAEIVTENDGTFALKSLPPNHLAVGMVINQNLYTKSGVPVAKSGTKITTTLLENILTMNEKKQLKDVETIDVKIPV